MKAEMERVETELHAKWDDIIQLFKENAAEMGVTLFLPHVAQDAYKKCLESSRWLGLMARSRRSAQIDATTMRILNYKLENPMPDEIVERIYEQDIFVVLWQNGNENESIDRVLDEFVRTVSEPRLRESGIGSEIAQSIIQPRILNPLIIYLDANANSDEQIDKTSTSSYDGNKSNRGSTQSVIHRKSSQPATQLDDRKSLSRQSQVLNKAERISMTDRKSIQEQRSESTRPSKASLHHQQRDSLQRSSGSSSPSIEQGFSRKSLVRVSRATLLSATMMEDEDDDR